MQYQIFFLKETLSSMLLLSHAFMCLLGGGELGQNQWRNFGFPEGTYPHVNRKSVEKPNRRGDFESAGNWYQSLRCLTDQLCLKNVQLP